MSESLSVCVFVVLSIGSTPNKHAKKKKIMKDVCEIKKKKNMTTSTNKRQCVSGSTRQAAAATAAAAAAAATHATIGLFLSLLADGF